MRKRLYFVRMDDSFPDLEGSVRLLHGLSDRSRLAILGTLLHRERRVTDVVAETSLSQPNVSRHLACLWGCGLVMREKRGREVFYRAIPGVGELLQAVDTVLDSAGETMNTCPTAPDPRARPAYA